MINIFKIQTIIVIGILVICQNVNSQTAADIVRMSMTKNNTTARSLALGGSNGSMGGDFSGIVKNPATLGIYRTNSNFGITLSGLFNNSSSNYLNNSTKENQQILNLNQIAYIHSNAPRDITKKKESSSTTWALSYNNLGQNSQTFSFEGNNYNSSILQVFANNLNNNSYNFTDSIAEAKGMVYKSSSDNLFHATSTPSTGLKQKYFNETKGAANELAFSLAKNDENKVMYGITISMPIYKYNMQSVYSEDDLLNDLNNEFGYVDYIENVKTSAVGINTKMGLLFLPLPNIRIGLTYQTPSMYSATDQYTLGMDGTSEGFSSLDNQLVSQDFQYSYKVITPGKFGLSGTYLFFDKGLFTIDYEFTRLENSKINTTLEERSFQNYINTNIVKNYQAIHTIKTGIEARYKKYYFRIGGNYSSSPLSKDYSFKTKNYGYALGVGVKGRNQSYDITFTHTQNQFGLYAYTNSMIVSEPAKININNNQLTLSIGFN